MHWLCAHESKLPSIKIIICQYDISQHMKKGTLWFSSLWIFKCTCTVPYLGYRHAFFAWSLLKVSSTCLWAAKALARLCSCAGLSDFFFFFFWFGVYGPFKNISLISSRSFIRGGQKPENPGKNHLTIRKQNLPASLLVTHVISIIFSCTGSYVFSWSNRIIQRTC